MIFHPETDFLVRHSNAVRYNFCVINRNKVIDCFYPHIGAQHAHTIRSYDKTVMNRYRRTVYDCDCSFMFYHSTSSCRDCIKIFLLALFLMSLNVNYLICTVCFFSHSALLHKGFEML